MPSSSASLEKRPSMTSVFSQAPISTLTHEEECMLKTALAMVVVKQRKKAGQFQQVMDAQKKARIANEGQRKGLLDRLFVHNSPSNRSSLLLLSHRQHLDRIFQAALNMSSNALHHSSSPGQDSIIHILNGTCSHLASQLQTWLQEEEEEEEEERAKTEAVAAEQEEHVDDNRPQNGKGSSSSNEQECSNWIRRSLMATPCRATFQVYYNLLQFGNSQLNGVILNILIKLLLEAYHDRLVLPPTTTTTTKKPTTNGNLKAPPAYSTNASSTVSYGSNANTTLDDTHKSIDWLTVSWLRLTHRCVQYLSPADIHSILHNSSALAHLLLPFETSSGNQTTPSLVQTFWEMSTLPSATSTAGIVPFPRTTNNTWKAPARLGTGAKMLLRLGLYRLLFYN
ncbi:unnamed protein product, partial [Cylindrotheca closterium]